MFVFLFPRYSKEHILLISIVHMLDKYSQNTVIRQFIEDSQIVLLFVCTVPFQN